jgi:hypothetical protein
MEHNSAAGAGRDVREDLHANTAKVIGGRDLKELAQRQRQRQSDRGDRRHATVEQKSRLESSRKARDGLVPATKLKVERI